jgi:molybdopterin molybdotransferase
MAIVAQHQWVVFTGAVSMGSRDFLPRVLAELGGVGVFHGVAQRPGKPAGFWVGPQGQAIIALPGNPVSALTGLHAFVLPALSSAAGEKPVARQRVMPAGAITGLPGMTWHLPVVLDDRGFARPAPTGNSGDFIGLLGSDGFVTLPPGGDHQEPLPYTPWR